MLLQLVGLLNDPIQLKAKMEFIQFHLNAEKITFPTQKSVADFLRAEIFYKGIKIT